MDRSTIPEAAFVDPTGDNAAAVSTLVDDTIELLIEKQSGAGARKPLPAEPLIPAADVPEDARSWDALLADLDGVVEGSMNPAHPGYVGHMDTIPTTVSVLGDLVASALNNNMLSVEMSPVFSVMEDELLAAVATAFGLGADAGGVLTSGGSLANLHALAVARNAAFDVHGAGLGGGAIRPVLYASADSHTSLQKAAMLLGLGTEAVVPVETDRNSRMRPAALSTAIERVRDDGRDPFCVVGTAGTTTTGNVDPLAAVADVADEHGLWFHVDAAYGGALVFSDAERHRLDGVEAADSVTFNPQKWCYVAKTCAMALFADTDVLHEAFRVGAPYMRDDEAVPNLGELSVQGTRRADVLKLWLTFQHLGRRGLEQLVEEGYHLTALASERIDARDALERASEPETNILCFRAAPDWCAAADLDALNNRLQQTLLDDHDVFVSLPTYRDARWLRLVLLNPFTDESIVERLFDGVDAFLTDSRP